MINDGIEEHFYIPMEYYKEWNKLLLDSGLNKFRFGSTGIPLGKPKTSNHLYIEGKLKCIEFGYDKV